MPQYRVYIFGEHGQVNGVLSLDVTDDLSAKECTKELAEAHVVELWRLVADTDPTISAAHRSKA